MAQLIGSASVTGATLIAAFGLMYAVKATGTLRVSKFGELEGLDLHEHGLSADPEFSVPGSPSLSNVYMSEMPAAMPVGSPSTART